LVVSWMVVNFGNIAKDLIYVTPDTLQQVIIFS